MSYTKLFSEIIMSTIWREPDHVRILWITMLAAKDQFHHVNASIPGLADAARISLQQCEEALRILSDPDEYSRNQYDDGRRIKEIDGGWSIINGELYREKMNADERREYLRIKQQEYRDRKKSSTRRKQTLTNVNTVNTSEQNRTDIKSTCANADAFDTFWSCYPRKQDKKKARAAFMSMSKKNQAAAISDSATRFDSTDKQFIPLPTTYLHGERWNDDIDSAKADTNKKLADMVRGEYASIN